MAYLSLITLNPLRRETQRLISSPQRLHAAVLRGLPQDDVTQRVLWRLERRERTMEVLVLTQRRPSWAALVESAGWPGADGGEGLVKDYDPLLARVAVGREFSFRVVTNPTSTLSVLKSPTAQQRASLDDASRKRGIRVGHRTAGTQLGWFLARAAGDFDTWGFTVGVPGDASVELVARRHESFIKGVDRRRVTLDTATFEGRLKVTDTERFTATLLGGLGRGKAYGCGLLTLAPPREAAHVVEG